MSAAQNQPSIPEFYANKRVFITGGLGFIGKVIVEKLLRSCPDVDKIYLLARSKKGKDVNERLNDYINSPAFDLIRDKNPEAFKKILLIKGDICEDNFGMSEADQELFFDNVNVIIHSAATLTFNEPLKIAINTNVKPMKTLLGFARKVKNLDAFVHISTTYTNWFLPEVEEEFYPLKHDPNELIELERITDQENMDKLTPKLLGQHVNTYTMTKSLSETLIWKEARGLPMCIVRPSMTISSYEEPKPGWIDSWAAVTFYAYMSSIGLMRAVHVIGKLKCNIVCADHVSNMVIAAGWKTAVENKNLPANNENLPKIYNCTTASKNAITWNFFWDNMMESAKKYPLTNTVFYPRLKIRDTKFRTDFDTFFKHTIPAYAVDTISKLSGGKPKLAKIQKMFSSNFSIVRFTTTESFNFTSVNVPKLRDSMTANDQANFNFDFRKVDINKTLLDYHMGIRRHLLNQNDNTLPAARSKLARLKIANFAILGSMAAVSLLAVGGLAKVLLKRDNKEEKMS